METELERWSRIFSGSSFYYGFEAGPVARRAVRYHRPLKNGGQALDAGCGEGQDLLFLAKNGYECRGLDFTENGLQKAQQLLDLNGVQAHLEQADLKTWVPDQEFDLVLAVNSLQFLGEDAPRVLQTLKAATRAGGVIGLSMFARDDQEQNPLDGTIYRWHLEELIQTFSDWQPFEAARLYQWGQNGPQPFVTLIAANLRP